MPKRVSKKTKGSGSTPDPRKPRLTSLRRAMRDADIDALLLTDASDVTWATGFDGDSSYALVTSKQCVLITDFRFEEDAEAVRGVATVRMRSGPIAKETADTASELGVERLGLPSSHVTLALRSAIGKSLGTKKLTEVEDLVGPLRAVKDEGELKLIRKAVRTQEAALESALEQIAPGMTEFEACALLEWELKSRGSLEPSFGIIMAASANASKPHAVPGRKKIARKQPLLIDWGATVGGYRSDMTRVVSFGPMNKQMREIYEIVREAFEAGVEAIRPGVTGREVDAAARSVIKDAGYGDRFGHSLGHGIGLDVHEAPRLSAQSDDVLAEGMVVTVEPGIYLPGVGGVRLEDDVVVTAKGSRKLSRLPKSLDWAER